MKHQSWVDEEADCAMNEADSERERFFDGLYVELCKDYIEVEADFEGLSTELFREVDGSYTVCEMATVEESMPGMVEWVARWEWRGFMRKKKQMSITLQQKMTAMGCRLMKHG